MQNQKWHSATQVAQMRNIAVATVIGLIEDGDLEAVNIARKASKRKRYRVSDGMLSAFDEKRTSKKPEATPESKSSRRTIARPTKDYFAETEVMKQ